MKDNLGTTSKVFKIILHAKVRNLPLPAIMFLAER